MEYWQNLVINMYSSFFIYNRYFLCPSCNCKSLMWCNMLDVPSPQNGQANWVREDNWPGSVVLLCLVGSFLFLFCRGEGMFVFCFFLFCFVLSALKDPKFWENQISFSGNFEVEHGFECMWQLNCNHSKDWGAKNNILGEIMSGLKLHLEKKKAEW